MTLLKPNLVQNQMELVTVQLYWNLKAVKVQLEPSVKPVLISLKPVQVPINPGTVALSSGTVLLIFVLFHCDVVLLKDY